MKKIHFFKINPLNWFKGIIKFPIGFFKFEPCDINEGKPCRTCGEGGKHSGFGIMFLFFGISIRN